MITVNFSSPRKTDTVLNVIHFRPKGRFVLSSEARRITTPPILKEKIMILKKKTGEFN